MHPSDPEPAPDHTRLPRHTTPTWEMELLISGATVFALLQLPAVLDTVFNTAFPRFDRTVSPLILLPYLYVKIATYALIVTFVLHLATRGYWVALVGLRSVYPDGIRWEGRKWGPHYLAVMRARVPPIDELVERADNRASLVFGFGTGFALLMLAPLAMVLVAAVPAYLLHWLTDGRFDWFTLWQVTFFSMLLPFGAAVLADRFLGHRLAPEGHAARTLRGLFRGYLRAGFSSFSSYPILMFVTRFGQRRSSVVLAAATFALATVVVLQMAWRAGEFDPGSYADALTGEPGEERTLVPAHYADQRLDPDAMKPLPYIQSEIARDDYVRLFIPFRPSRDNAALAKSCPQAAQAQRESAARVLDCLALLYPIALDEVTIADPRFDRAQDPGTGLRGVIAMIPVGTLAPGRHELQVGFPPSPRRGPDDPAEPSYRIAFWR
jgi:hypothetical protein